MKSFCAWWNSMASPPTMCTSSSPDPSPPRAKSTARNCRSVRRQLQGGALVTSFTAYQPRTFALRLGAAPAKVDRRCFAAGDAALRSRRRQQRRYEDHRRLRRPRATRCPPRCCLRTLEFNGVQFKLAPAGTGKPERRGRQGTEHRAARRPLQPRIRAGRCRGRRSERRVPRRRQSRADVKVEDWGGFIGQWDTRLWKPRPQESSRAGRRARQRLGHDTVAPRLGSFGQSRHVGQSND